MIAASHSSRTPAFHSKNGYRCTSLNMQIEIFPKDYVLPVRLRAHKQILVLVVPIIAGGCGLETLEQNLTKITKRYPLEVLVLHPGYHDPLVQ